MKKTFYFCFSTLLLLFILPACSSEGTPSATVEKFGEYMKSEKYDKILDLMDMGEDITDAQLNFTRQLFSSTMEVAAKEMKEQNGGLKKIEAVSEERSADGKEATVKTRTYFENGETEDGEMDLVLIDGKWKMKTGF
ncbi:MAG: DUF4878 domain-containing protein [Candidatus Azobacteroides sp.]|nr:DUF4878 domain-containing protein [Candidatus Azobacteroides sp.]